MAADDPPLIKVRLHDGDEDSETCWARDLGAVEGRPDARRVRIENVPMFHAKPTWGDVVLVEPDELGVLAWNLDGTTWDNIAERIEADGGRYTMIVDYLADEGVDTDAFFAALCKVARDHDVMPEGCYGPKGDEPGRLYLAVPEAIPPDAMMQLLIDVPLDGGLELVHPRDDDDDEHVHDASCGHHHAHEHVHEHEHEHVHDASCGHGNGDNGDN